MKSDIVLVEFTCVQSSFCKLFFLCAFTPFSLSLSPMSKHYLSFSFIHFGDENRRKSDPFFYYYSFENRVAVHHHDKAMNFIIHNEKKSIEIHYTIDIGHHHHHL